MDPEPILQRKVDSLEVIVYSSVVDMAKAAAQYVVRQLQQFQAEVPLRLLFAAAPSQALFLAELLKLKLPWQQIEAMHIDEYLDLPVRASQRFGSWLDTHLFSHTQFRTVHYMLKEHESADACMQRYAQLLATPAHLACLGIGENGHIAFNDPPVADFADPEIIKPVTLDATCRQQQVNDGCFTSLALVPKQALTLTIPALMQSKVLSVVVPGERKAAAVHTALSGTLSTHCPASILRTHPHAKLFLDRSSAADYLNSLAPEDRDSRQ